MRVVMSGMALTSECNHEPFLFRLMSDPKFSKLVLYSIDTGIDYNHSSLGGGFGKGFKVNGGFDFVGDAFTGKDILVNWIPALMNYHLGSDTSRPVPDSDPRDTCNGKHIRILFFIHEDISRVVRPWDYGSGTIGLFCHFHGTHEIC